MAEKRHKFGLDRGLVRSREGIDHIKFGICVQKSLKLGYVCLQFGPYIVTRQNIHCSGHCLE